MERIILNKLNFTLCLATPLAFLRRFLKAAGATKKIGTVAFLAAYLLELSLIYYAFVRYYPSCVAAAAVFVSLRTLGRKDAWVCFFYPPPLPRV